MPSEAKLREEIDFLGAKIENLLFVIWIQDQRHDYWMKFIKEVREAMQKLREVGGLCEKEDRRDDGEGCGRKARKELINRLDEFSRSP